MMSKKTHLVLIFITALLSMFPAFLQAQQGLEVVKIVLSEQELEIGGEQLVQVSVRNHSKKDIRAGFSVDIRAKKERPTGIERKRVVSIPGESERKLFFPLRVPDYPGDYAVRLLVTTPNYKKNILTGEPVFFQKFIIRGGGILAGEQGADSMARMYNQRSIARLTPPEGLEFERPDLIWENFSAAPVSILFGETLKIKADLRNSGGDIAREVDVRVEYYNVRVPTRKLVIAKTPVAILAPGEKIQLEYEHRFPDDALLGEYHISMIADATESVTESNEKNNTTLTPSPIRLASIRQVFPEPDFVFDDAALFIFRWDSTKFDEFKVQVGVETTFENPEGYFDIPQGDIWTKATEASPLAGEMPGMLWGLMKQRGTDVAYWRVIGRKSGTEKIGYSLSLPFQLSKRLQAEAEQENQAQEQADKERERKEKQKLRAERRAGRPGPSSRKKSEAPQTPDSAPNTEQEAAPAQTPPSE